MPLSLETQARRGGDDENGMPRGDRHPVLCVLLVDRLRLRRGLTRLHRRRGVGDDVHLRGLAFSLTGIVTVSTPLL
jgi:hypothetical protein